MKKAFIASLGNPGAAYENTLHSAGHVLLNSLVRHAQAPPLMASRRYGGALFSELPNAAFWQSPSYMNNSARYLVPAWWQWAKTIESQNDQPHLVILHDELEEVIGKFKLRTGIGLSHRGHNGLRSVLGASTMRNLKITRIGVGIGPRPLSREPNVVADFVLRRMNEKQREEIELLARPVWRRLA